MSPTNTRLQIITRLHNGIYASSGGGLQCCWLSRKARLRCRSASCRYPWGGQAIAHHQDYASGPRGTHAAAKKMAEVRASKVRSYGDIGCGATWLRVVEGDEHLDIPYSMTNHWGHGEPMPEVPVGAGLAWWRAEVEAEARFWAGWHREQEVGASWSDCGR